MQSSAQNRFNYWNDSLLEGLLPKPLANRYLVFDVDQGGLNNIRMAFEYVVVLAALTGRTLVMPPKSPWYLINCGPIPKELQGGATEFKDIYNIDALAQAIQVISTDQFIADSAVHLAIPEKFVHKPNLADDHEARKAWREWLLNNTEIPTWNPYNTLVCWPTIESALEGPHMEEKYLDSRIPVEFSPWMAASPVLYFPSTKEYRSLGPVATMLAGEDDSMPCIARRLLKHHVRYRDEIFQLTNDIIDALGLESFDALQIRRNDFQYKKTRVSTQKIIDNVSVLFDQKLPLYIATDEDRKEVFDDLAEGLNAPEIFTWQDVESVIEESIPYAWIGPIEQLICAFARRFVGNDLSTFTSYIHRLRGYNLAEDQSLYFHNKMYPEIPEPTKMSDFRGRAYLRENPLFWLKC